MGKPLPKQAILVVNAASRRGAAAFDDARKKLEEAGVELIEAHAVEDPSKIDQVVKSAIQKAPMVIVGGGDGSLSSNVDHFVGAPFLSVFVEEDESSCSARLHALSPESPTNICVHRVISGDGSLRHHDGLGRLRLLPLRHGCEDRESLGGSG